MRRTGAHPKWEVRRDPGFVRAQVVPNGPNRTARAESYSQRRSSTESTSAEPDVSTYPSAAARAQGWGSMGWGAIGCSGRGERI
jgi:hypothetical protein